MHESQPVPLYRLNIVADIMMAKVARWMRLLGIKVNDAKYIDDTQILNYIKRYRHPVLLTSDVEFSRRAEKIRVKAICVPSNIDLNHQVAYVLKRMDIDASRIKAGSLCTSCGARLIRINKASLESDKIPKNSLDAYDKFYKCPKCGKTYWRGSHWSEIDSRINEILSIYKNEKQNKSGIR
ncbi:PIN domain and zinc ribbon domain protein [Candidatus Mancarchaeum acidiphilum]|uniref:PIN domain and zinc ribbon domain protein n=1 Tax=Candidatus Mancarchaeum acidiphilum TaxID=1920749 RepID=A0A218NNN1_9ARCH|nr:Mut7-C RNAse domain-containing protein [Candidatus Mancarchaeum acidiphilum]ASI14081.1 PIN domain and zinc ribbon domain protein [Candidatus Mancarchaeum acidiphilum]